MAKQGTCRNLKTHELNLPEYCHRGGEMVRLIHGCAGGEYSMGIGKRNNANRV